MNEYPKVNCKICRGLASESSDLCSICWNLFAAIDIAADEPKRLEEALVRLRTPVHLVLAGEEFEGYQIEGVYSSYQKAYHIVEKLQVSDRYTHIDVWRKDEVIEMWRGFWKTEDGLGLEDTAEFIAIKKVNIL